MTLRLAVFLLVLHLVAAFTTLAFSPDSCEPGDIGCGDETLSNISQRSASGEASLAGSVLTTIWDGTKSFFGPIIGLISFDHPWLQITDLPELAAWIVGALRTFLALLHIWVLYKTLATALGRTT